LKRRRKAPQVTTLDDLRGYLAEGLPILVDLWQVGCQPCRVMEGIVDELADEFSGRAHVVKIDVGRVPGAAQAFAVRSTPTFVVLARPLRPPSKRARRRGAVDPAANGRGSHSQPALARQQRCAGHPRGGALQRRPAHRGNLSPMKATIDYRPPKPIFFGFAWSPSGALPAPGMGRYPHLGMDLITDLGGWL
jgi:thiol-disulfide isomerase/thioredoxin